MEQHYYILDGKTPVPVEMIEWAEWMKADKDFDQRRIAYDETPNGNVSTVFLGINHGWRDDEIILFETMVFDGPYSEEQERYTTYEEAEAGHARWLERVLALPTEAQT